MEFEELFGKVQSLFDKISLSLSNEDMHTLWNEVRNIQLWFNSHSRVLTQEQQACWNLFQGARNALFAKEREFMKDNSIVYARGIMDIVQKAHIPDSFSPTQPFSVALKYLTQVDKWLWEAGDMLRRYKKEMFREHKDKCYEAIIEARKKYDACIVPTRRLDSIDRAKYRIAKNHEALNRCTITLNRQQRLKQKLEKEIIGSYNDPEWIDVCARPWIQGHIALINDIKVAISRHEKWIQEDEELLRSLQ